MDFIDQASPSRAAARTDRVGPVRRSADSRPMPGDDRRWWHVDCRDVKNTRRTLTVLANRDRVVLVGPPGDSVALPTGGVGVLSSALRKAAEQARK